MGAHVASLPKCIIGYVASCLLAQIFEMADFSATYLIPYQMWADARLMQGLAKYGLKTLLTLLRTNQIIIAEDAAQSSSSTEVLDSVWSVALNIVINGTGTFGVKQATVTHLALQVCSKAS